MPATTEARTEFAFGQTRVNEAIVACALERYRQAQGQFPESLEPLSPRFLPNMTHDLITGAPLLRVSLNTWPRADNPPGDPSRA